MSQSITRAHVGPRMSGIAIYNATVYLAGQVALKNPDAGIAEQTKEVLAAVECLLAEAGSDKSRILQCQIFLRDIADIGAMNAVWDAWIPAGNTPPRATVQAALADPRWSIEVLVTASLG